jgi:hypothetical protein
MFSSMLILFNFLSCTKFKTSLEYSCQRRLSKIPKSRGGYMTYQFNCEQCYQFNCKQCFQNKSVIGIDVLHQHIKGGVLKTERILQSRFPIPSWASRVISFSVSFIVSNF